MRPEEDEGEQDAEPPQLVTLPDLLFAESELYCVHISQVGESGG
jgi:hypothetical protein